MSRPTATQLGMPLWSRLRSDEDMAQTVADGMVADKEEALKKLEKAKSKVATPLPKRLLPRKNAKRRLMQPNRNCSFGRR